MTTPQEMKKLMDEIGSSVAELKNVQKQSLEKQDGLLAAQEQRLAEHITKSQEQLQNLQLKLDAAQRVSLNREQLTEQAKSAKGLMGNIKLGQPWSQERKDALSSYLRRTDKEVEAKLSSFEAAELKDFTVNVDSNGGFMVAPEMADFMSTVAFETSPLRSVARTMTISSDALEIPLNDKRFTVNKVGETQTAGKSATPDFGLIRIPTYIYEARPQASQKMLDDAAWDVEGYIAREVADEIGRAENTDFFTGNGSTAPQGLLTLPAWASAGTYERNKLEQILSGTSGAVTADFFKSLQGSLKEAYQANATWLMKRSTWLRALTLKDGQGRYLIGNDLLAGNFNQPELLGKKVVLCDDMAAVGANSLSVAYGDFQRGYIIVDRIGVRILRDPYTAKPMVEFYTTKRTGGGVYNFDCIKLGKCA